MDDILRLVCSGAPVHLLSGFRRSTRFCQAHLASASISVGHYTNEITPIKCNKGGQTLSTILLWWITLSVMCDVHIYEHSWQCSAKCLKCFECLKTMQKPHPKSCAHLQCSQGVGLGLPYSWHWSRGAGHIHSYCTNLLFWHFCNQPLIHVQLLVFSLQTNKNLLIASAHTFVAF